ncbi:hypothetical protein [uncultured Intestinimonas sp.]|uniref:hypothetical protein n=1 Tax=uncultured Intestinimonas sp. TaxID=1689265 RepID=UPI0025FF76D4|nr:hypothetical protein [uncultured Intestinimonas sp.]
MKLGKRLAAAGLAAVMTLTLAACGGDVTPDEAKAYIQGMLDSYYLGQYNEDYLELMDITAEEAEEQNYVWNTEAEADIMMDAFAMYPTETTTAKMVDLVKEIYSHSRYEVQSASKLEDGSYAVTVSIEPIDILVQFFDNYDINTIWADTCSSYGVTTQEQIDAMSDEEYEALENAYADAVIAGVQGLMPDLGYEPAQSLVIQLQLEDNIYTMVGTDWQHLDGMIIDYSGQYAG